MLKTCHHNFWNHTKLKLIFSKLSTLLYTDTSINIIETWKFQIHKFIRDIHILSGKKRAFHLTIKIMFRSKNQVLIQLRLFALASSKEDVNRTLWAFSFLHATRCHSSLSISVFVFNDVHEQQQHFVAHIVYSFLHSAREDIREVGWNPWATQHPCRLESNGGCCPRLCAKSWRISTKARQF